MARTALADSMECVLRAPAVTCCSKDGNDFIGQRGPPVSIAQRPSRHGCTSHGVCQAFSSIGGRPLPQVLLSSRIQIVKDTVPQSHGSG